MPQGTTHPLPAKPRRNIFDAWNSSSTGHQRAENRLSGSTSWRDSRTAKLASQFMSGPGGGKRVADTVGGGSDSFDRGDRTSNGGWKRGVVRDRDSGQISLWESFGVKKEEADDGEQEGSMKRRRVDEGEMLPPALPYTRHRLGSIRTPSPERPWPRPKTPPGTQRRASASDAHGEQPQSDPTNHRGKDTKAHLDLSDESPSFDLERLYSPVSTPSNPSQDSTASTPSSQQPPTLPAPAATSASNPPVDPGVSSAPPTPPQIFRNLTFYINGSTHPTISDHKLKRLLVQHGGAISLALARRTVTHVILGRPNGTGPAEGAVSNQRDAALRRAGGRGAGGALAAGKIQREVGRGGAGGVRYVGVEWVVESVRAGRRVGEARFEGLGIRPAGVRGIGAMFAKERGMDGQNGV